MLILRFLRINFARSVSVSSTKYSVRGFFHNQTLVAALDLTNYEECVDDVFRTVLSLQDGAVIDVGANVGQTMLSILAIDKHRQYVGFEPQISCCFFIDQFITDNQLNTHTIIPIGLSDSRGLLKLGLNRSHDVTASIADDYRPEGFYSYYTLIPVFSGDEALEPLELSSISLVKIDVEGAELEVIRGLSRMIVEHNPYIVFEVLPHFLLSTGEEISESLQTIRNRKNDEITSELQTHGYVIYQVQPESGIRKVDDVKAAKRLIYNHVAVPADEEKCFTEAYGGPIIA